MSTAMRRMMNIVIMVVVTMMNTFTVPPHVRTVTTSTDWLQVAFFIFGT